MHQLQKNTANENSNVRKTKKQNRLMHNALYKL